MNHIHASRKLRVVRLVLIIIFLTNVWLGTLLGNDLRAHHFIRAIFDGVGLLFALWCLIHSAKTLPRLPQLNQHTDTHKGVSHKEGQLR